MLDKNCENCGEYYIIEDGKDAICPYCKAEKEAFYCWMCSFQIPLKANVRKKCPQCWWFKCPNCNACNPTCSESGSKIK